MSKKNSNNKNKNTNTTKKANSGSPLIAGDMRKTKTDYDIPRIGYKSAFVIIGAAAFSTIILPLILGLVGLPFEPVAILGNAFITGFSVAYSRFFIETKRGFCKRFWFTYAGFALACVVVAFFWIALETYV